MKKRVGGLVCPFERFQYFDYQLLECPGANNVP